jgi:Zn-dependent protease
MAWEDRPHYRDHSGTTNPLVWLVSGSLPLGSVFGVRFRAHSSLILFALVSAVFMTAPVSMRLLCMALWLAALVVHELAHAIVARRQGGFADEAILWPAGGLVVPESPHRASANFVAAIAGPGANLFLAVAAGFGVYVLTPMYITHGAVVASGVSAASVSVGHVIVPLNPFVILKPEFSAGWGDPAMYCWWIFAINYRLFLLNLVPIFPLDGGRMMQCVIWPMAGHFRSLMIETSVGMAGAVAVGLVSLATGYYVVAVCMMFCFFQAYQRRLILNESGGEDWRDSFDFSSSLFGEEKPRRKRLSRRTVRKARRIAQQEKAVRDRIDEILAKVSKTGITSLTWVERRALKKATQQSRRSETELSKFQ